jgi:pyridoxine 4-dehydrogenase
MKTRKIAGRTVNSIGLGAMALDEYSPIPSEEDAISLLKYAVEKGVNFIDTADVYGLGRNEILIGKAFDSNLKEKISIATKGGCTRPNGTGWGTDGRPEHLKEALQKSFERLGLKKIWLYQLHAPDQNVPFMDSVKALKEMQENGLIEHIGLSNVNVEQFQEASRTVDIVSVQNHFNLSHRDDENSLLPFLAANNVSFLCYFPLGGGKLLTNPKLVSMSSKLGMTSSQLALAWILNKWPNAIPIPGTKNKEHLDINLKAIDFTLSENNYKEIEELF